MASWEGESGTSNLLILGRTLRWTEDGLEYTADERHREQLMKATGLNETSNGVVGPAAKDDMDEPGDEDDIGAAESARYRGAAARLNYLAQDRCDIQYATKEVCSTMSSPTGAGWRKIKRVVWYMVKAKAVV